MRFIVIAVSSWFCNSSKSSVSFPSWVSGWLGVGRFVWLAVSPSYRVGRCSWSHPFWVSQALRAAAGREERGGFEYAIAQPELEVFGQPLHPALEEVAAAYLCHLCQSHAFVDGDERTALAAMLVFLHLNGFRLTASDVELFNLVLGVARGELDKAALGVRLRDWLEPHTNI